MLEKENREFLGYITLCFGCNIEEKVYNTLINIEISLKNYFKEFMDVVYDNKNYNGLIECLGQVLDNKPKDISVKDYLDDYLEYVKAMNLLKLKEAQTFKDLYEHIKDSNIKNGDGFEFAKVLTVEQVTLEVDNKRYKLVKSLGMDFNFETGLKENTGGVLVKDNKAQFLKVKDKSDEVELLKYLVTKDDYALAIIPRFGFIPTLEYDTWTKELTNKSYARLSNIIGNGLLCYDNDHLDEYHHIRNHRINAVNLLELLEKTMLNKIKLSLIGLILDELDKIDNEETRNKVYKDIIKILTQRIRLNNTHTINEDFRATIYNIKQIKSVREIGLEEFLELLNRREVWDGVGRRWK